MPSKRKIVQKTKPKKRQKNVSTAKDPNTPKLQTGVEAVAPKRRTLTTRPPQPHPGTPSTQTANDEKSSKSSDSVKVTDRFICGCLYLSVFIDIFAVSLVVPMLPTRYKSLGVDALTIGFYGSVYSGAQIIGGVIFGYLSDSILGRRTVLLISMFGAALSYAIVGFTNSIPLLLLSRVIVGLTKQTMTTSSAIVASVTTTQDRADSFGRLSSAATGAWLLGQSVGGVLATRIGPEAPAAVAIALYVVDASLVLWTVPSMPPTPKGEGDTQRGVGLWSTIAFARNELMHGNIGLIIFLQAAVLLVHVSFTSLQRVYEQGRYDLEPEQIGFLGSFRGIITVLSNAFFVGWMVHKYGGVKVLLVGIGLACVAQTLQAFSSDVWLYLWLSVPLRTVGRCMTTLSLKSLFAAAVPQRRMQLALSSLDILSSVCGLVAPTLGGALLYNLGVDRYPIAAASSSMALLCLVYVMTGRL